MKVEGKVEKPEIVKVNGKIRQFLGLRVHNVRTSLFCGADQAKWVIEDVFSKSLSTEGTAIRDGINNLRDHELAHALADEKMVNEAAYGLLTIRHTSLVLFNRLIWQGVIRAGYIPIGGRTPEQIEKIIRAPRDPSQSDLRRLRRYERV